MPSSSSSGTPVPDAPDERTALWQRRIGRLLRAGIGHGFHLTVLEVPDATEEVSARGWFERQCREQEATLIAVDLQKLPGKNLWQELSLLLSPLPPRAVLLLHGLPERESSGEAPSLIRQFNVQRDPLVRDFKAIWVLLAAPRLRMRLQMEAPDFVDFVSYWHEAVMPHPSERYDWFLAYHPDSLPSVRRFYRSLVASGLSVFFDEACLLPDDDRARMGQQAQQEAVGTILCVPTEVSVYWYDREFVKWAIKESRASKHRLIPVALDGMPAHRPWNLDSVKILSLAEFSDLLPRLLSMPRPDARAVPAVSTAPEPTRPSAEQIVDAWTKMLPSMRQQILQLKFPEARYHLPASGTPMEEAVMLVQWLRIQREETTDRLIAAIREVAPALL